MYIHYLTKKKQQEIQSIHKVLSWLKQKGLDNKIEISFHNAPTKSKYQLFHNKDFKFIFNTYNWNKNNKLYVGSQLDTLIAFCKQENIENIELCLELGQNKPSTTSVIFHPFLISDKKDSYIIDTKTCPFYFLIFSCLKFPTIYMSKQQMKYTAISCHFDEPLYMSWFCEIGGIENNGFIVPYKKCFSCKETLEEGFIERF
jgi:hypothetical protein